MLPSAFNNNWSAVDSYLISIHQGDIENVEMLFRSARTSVRPQEFILLILWTPHNPCLNVVFGPGIAYLPAQWQKTPRGRWGCPGGVRAPATIFLEDRVCIGQKLGWRSWPWTQGPSWWSSRCPPPTPCPWVTRCTSRGRFCHVGKSCLWFACRSFHPGLVMPK